MDAGGSARKLRHQRAWPQAGVQHLGIQVENRIELADVTPPAARRWPGARRGATTCCYAKSEKSWIEDPQGVKWETFLTTGESTTYGSDTESPRAPVARRKPPRGGSNGRAAIQGAFPVYRELGAQHPRRVAVEPSLVAASFAATAPAASRRVRSTRSRSSCCGVWTCPPKVCAARAGMSSRSPEHRHSTSSSPSATTLPAKSARSGPDILSRRTGVCPIPRL